MNNKRKGVLAGLGLLAGIPALANAIGWTLTGISVACLALLAVLLYRKVVGDGASNDDTSSNRKNLQSYE